MARSSGGAGGPFESETKTEFALFTCLFFRTSECSLVVEPPTSKAKQVNSLKELRQPHRQNVSSIVAGIEES